MHVRAIDAIFLAIFSAWTGLWAGIFWVIPLTELRSPAVFLLGALLLAFLWGGIYFKRVAERGHTDVPHSRQTTESKRWFARLEWVLKCLYFLVLINALFELMEALGIELPPTIGWLHSLKVVLSTGSSVGLAALTAHALILMYETRQLIFFSLLSIVAAFALVIVVNSASTIGRQYIDNLNDLIQKGVCHPRIELDGRWNPCPEIPNLAEP
jgi:membrane protein implicated in regulation of membrane protease activity